MHNTMESLHKGLIIEEVSSLVFETLHHMKDACETQATESSFLSAYTIFRCTRDKIRLENLCVFNQYRIFSRWEKVTAKWDFFCMCL